MKICIVGLGAIGGLFAGWLASRLPPGEVEISALARGETLAAVRRRGLLLHGPAGALSLQLRVASDAAELGPQDLVVLAVKAPSLASVAPAVQSLLAPHTRVLTAMNGVPWWFFSGLAGPCEGLSLQSIDPGGVVAAAIPAEQVIGCVVHVSSLAPAPGEVRHISGTGLVIGHPAGRHDGVMDDSLEATSALLRRTGFTVTLSERIQREVWFKLWGNMTMNPISALTSATCDRILDDPLVRGFCSAVMLEAQAIGVAFGIPIEQRPEDRHAVTRKLGAFKTSMLQDLQASKPLELDALLGAVREIGGRLGLATPNIDALFGLARLLARQRGLYPAAPEDAGLRS